MPQACQVWNDRCQSAVEGSHGSLVLVDPHRLPLGGQGGQRSLQVPQAHFWHLHACRPLACINNKRKASKADKLRLRVGRLFEAA